MRVAITPGPLAESLVAELRAAGDEVIRLVEHPSRPDERRWRPAAGLIDEPGLTDVDAVVNLYAAPIWRRWTPEVRDEIRSTRLTGTMTIVSHLDPDGRCQRFANLSSTAIYGDRGDDILTADSPVGKGWLAGTTVDWESSLRHAPVPTVILRTPAVLGIPGGPLDRRRGLLAGRLGHGHQWRPWVHVTDWVAAARALLHGRFEGPIALAAPLPVREGEFAAALATASGRRPALPVPEAALRATLGAALTAEVLMASRRVVPRILSEELGFSYRFGALDLALADVVGGQR